jgi:hypothetical protein
VRTFNPWVEACVARGSATANPPARIQARARHRDERAMNTPQPAMNC